MIRRSLSRTVLAGGLLLAAAAPAAADHLDRIRVCALFNSSGVLAGADTPARHGAELAALETDKIELVSFDALSDLDRAVELSSRCIDAQHAAAGVGFSDSGFVQTVAPIFQKAGVPFVTLASTDPALPARIGPDLFLAGFGADAQAQALADFARRRLGVKRLALWTNSENDTAIAFAGFFRAAFEASGGRIVEERHYSSGDDFATAAGDLARQLGETRVVQGVFVAGLATDAAPAAAALRQAGVGLPILGGDSFDSEIWDTADVSLLGNVYFATHALRGREGPLVERFLTNYQQRYGKPPGSAFAALAYDALRLIADATGRMAPDAPTGLRDALAATHAFEGVTGTIDYSGGRQVPRKPVAVVRVERGTIEPVWTWQPAD